MFPNGDWYPAQEEGALKTKYPDRFQTGALVYDFEAESEEAASAYAQTWGGNLPQTQEAQTPEPEDAPPPPPDPRTAAAPPPKAPPAPPPKAPTVAAMTGEDSALRALRENGFQNPFSGSGRKVPVSLVLPPPPMPARTPPQLRAIWKEAEKNRSAFRRTAQAFETYRQVLDAADAPLPPAGTAAPPQTAAALAAGAAQDYNQRLGFARQEAVYKIQEAANADKLGKSILRKTAWVSTAIPEAALSVASGAAFLPAKAWDFLADAGERKELAGNARELTGLERGLSALERQVSLRGGVDRGEGALIAANRRRQAQLRGRDVALKMKLSNGLGDKTYRAVRGVLDNYREQAVGALSSEDDGVVLQGLRSVAQSLAVSLAAGGNPAAAGAAFASMAATDSYEEALASGKSEGGALLRAYADGAWNAASERIPFDVLKRAGGGGALKKAFLAALAEGLQEITQETGSSLIVRGEAPSARDLAFAGTVGAAMGGAFGAIEGAGETLQARATRREADVIELQNRAENAAANEAARAAAEPWAQSLRAAEDARRMALEERNAAPSRGGIPLQMPDDGSVQTLPRSQAGVPALEEPITLPRAGRQEQINGETVYVAPESPQNAKNGANPAIMAQTSDSFQPDGQGQGGTAGTLPRAGQDAQAAQRSDTEENARRAQARAKDNEVRAALKPLVGKVFKNAASGMEATLSNASIKKILSGKAKSKSVSEAAHYHAAIHVSELFENGTLTASEPGRKGEVKVAHKISAPFEYDGGNYEAKVTVLEHKTASGKRIYSVEALETARKPGGITAPSANGDLVSASPASADPTLPQSAAGVNGAPAAQAEPPPAADAPARRLAFMRGNAERLEAELSRLEGFLGSGLDEDGRRLTKARRGVIERSAKEKRQLLAALGREIRLWEAEQEASASAPSTAPGEAPERQLAPPAPAPSPAPKTAPEAPPPEVPAPEAAGARLSYATRGEDAKTRGVANAIEWEAAVPKSAMRVRLRRAFMDLDDVIASDDARYPQALQPRERSANANSDYQVAQIAAAPDPQRYAATPETTDRGLVIVTPRGEVLSGNGRVMAARRARANGAFGEVEAAFMRDARRFGADVGGMASPFEVAVLEGFGGMGAQQVAEMVEKSNVPDILSRTRAETAEADAKNILRPGALDNFSPGADGDLGAASNRDFVYGFIRASGDESLLDSRGQPSPEAYARVERALLSALFDGQPEARNLSRALIEDGQGEARMRVETRGLLKALPALMKSAAAKPAFDLRPALSEAYGRYMEFKRSPFDGMGAFLGQGALFGDGAETALAGRIMRAVFERRRSARKIGDLFNGYAALAQSVDETPPEARIPGINDSPVPAPEELFEIALARAEENENSALFAPLEGGRQTRNLAARNAGGNSAAAKAQAVRALQEDLLEYNPVRFTRANWAKEFPNGEVDTPLGKFRMGEHQFEKLLNMPDGRAGWFGMFKPTLNNPAVILREPDGKMLFMRGFTGADKRRYFAALTVERNGRGVVISGHRKNLAALIKKVESDKTVKVASPEAPQPTALSGGLLRGAEPTSLSDSAANIPQSAADVNGEAPGSRELRAANSINPDGLMDADAMLTIGRVQEIIRAMPGGIRLKVADLNPGGDRGVMGRASVRPRLGADGAFAASRPSITLDKSLFEVLPEEARAVMEEEAQEAHPRWRERGHPDRKAYEAQVAAAAGEWIRGHAPRVADRVTIVAAHELGHLISALKGGEYKNLMKKGSLARILADGVEEGSKFMGAAFNRRAVGQMRALLPRFFTGAELARYSMGTAGDRSELAATALAAHMINPRLLAREAPDAWLLCEASFNSVPEVREAVMRVRGEASRLGRAHDLAADARRSAEAHAAQRRGREEAARFFSTGLWDSLLYAFNKNHVAEKAGFSSGGKAGRAALREALMQGAYAGGARDILAYDLGEQVFSFIQERGLDPGELSEWLDHNRVSKRLQDVNLGGPGGKTAGTSLATTDLIEAQDPGKFALLEEARRRVQKWRRESMRFYKEELRFAMGADRAEEYLGDDLYAPFSILQFTSDGAGAAAPNAEQIRDRVASVSNLPRERVGSLEQGTLTLFNLAEQALDAPAFYKNNRARALIAKAFKGLEKDGKALAIPTKTDAKGNFLFQTRGQYRTVTWLEEGVWRALDIPWLAAQSFAPDARGDNRVLRVFSHGADAWKKLWTIWRPRFLLKNAGYNFSMAHFLSPDPILFPALGSPNLAGALARSAGPSMSFAADKDVSEDIRRLAQMGVLAPSREHTSEMLDRVSKRYGIDVPGSGAMSWADAAGKLYRKAERIPASVIRASEVGAQTALLSNTERYNSRHENKVTAEETARMLREVAQPGPGRGSPFFNSFPMKLLFPWGEAWRQSAASALRQMKRKPLLAFSHLATESLWTTAKVALYYGALTGALSKLFGFGDDEKENAALASGKPGLRKWKVFYDLAQAYEGLVRSLPLSDLLSPTATPLWRAQNGATLVLDTVRNPTLNIPKLAAAALAGPELFDTSERAVRRALRNEALPTFGPAPEITADFLSFLAGGAPVNLDGGFDPSGGAPGFDGVLSRATAALFGVYGEKPPIYDDTVWLERNNLVFVRATRGGANERRERADTELRETVNAARRGFAEAIALNLSADDEADPARKKDLIKRSRAREQDADDAITRFKTHWEGRYNAMHPEREPDLDLRREDFFDAARGSVGLRLMRQSVLPGDITSLPTRFEERPLPRATIPVAR
jgi:hypothetical protein